VQQRWQWEFPTYRSVLLRAQSPPDEIEERILFISQRKEEKKISFLLYKRTTGKNLFVQFTRRHAEAVCS
jgi:hypothetical protein